MAEKDTSIFGYGYEFPNPPWNTTIEKWYPVYLEFAVQFAHPEFVALAESAYDLREKYGLEDPRVKDAYARLEAWEKEHGDITGGVFKSNDMKGICEKHGIYCRSHGTENQELLVDAKDKKEADDKIRGFLKEVSALAGLEVVLTADGRIASPRFEKYPTLFSLCSI